MPFPILCPFQYSEALLQGLVLYPVKWNAFLNDLWILNGTTRLQMPASPFLAWAMECSEGGCSTHKCPAVSLVIFGPGWNNNAENGYRPK